MGLWFEMTYLCARRGGTFLLAYPNAMTQDKCRQLLDLLSQAVLTDPNSGAPMFIRAGLPAGTRVANKWGIDRQVRANAGVVFTSNGDFVLVIFLRQTNSGDWQQASSPMGDITVAAYNYFCCPGGRLSEKEAYIKYGFVLPTGDARDRQSDCVPRDAEQAGLGRLFVWEPVWALMPGSR
jgi:hypothetical protein